MGLDQNAYKVKSDYDSDSRTETTTKTELHYWRKHNRLQGWMENKYIDNGGKEQFNCVSLELTIDDIEQLDVVINNKMLPETGGFFFGNDSYSDYEGEYGYKDDDIKFIEIARDELNKGNKVFYSCWW